MKAALFRKLTIEGKNYYQIYDVVKDFEVTDEFADFTNRKDKDYTYLPLKDNMFSIYTNCKYLIFTGDNGTNFEQVPSSEYKKLFEAFNNVFHDLDDVELAELDEMEEQYDLITDDVYFQDDAVIDVLQTINRNWDIMESDVSINVKRSGKENLIIYGLPGNGKNTLVDSLKKNLDAPYADLCLSPDNEVNINRVVTELLNTAKNDVSLLSHGIVYIRDNFDELACTSDEFVDNPYLPLMNLLDSEIKISSKDGEFNMDLRDLTYVILINIPSYSEMEEYLLDTEDMPNMHFVMFNELTPSEQKIILQKNKNSIINQYRQILSVHGRSLKVYESFIDDIILLAKHTSGNMNMINGIISKMIKNEWYNDGKTITLTSNKLKEIMTYIDLDGEIQEEVKEETLVTENPSKELDESLDQLVELVKQTVCAQDEHIKRILYTILRNRRAANSKDLENPKKYIKNILIRGESGNGKTAILNEVSRLLKMPIFVADATSYTEAGYVGNSVEDMLKSLVQAANGDIEKAQRGILVIDEIDKKAAEQSRGTDVSREAVLNGLLKIIEGTIVPIEIGKGYNAKQVMFDTSRLTVICSGAFEDIEKIRDARLKTGNKKTIGFGSDNTQKNNNKEQVNKDPKIIDEDYIKYGMNKQFMGRFGVIVNLNKLTAEDHKTIMKKSKTSELVIQKKLSELEGITLTYEESFYDALAQKSYDKQIGARGIERAFQDVLDNINFMDITSSEYQEVIFTGECVSDPSKIILIPKEKGKVLKKSLN